MSFYSYQSHSFTLSVLHVYSCLIQYLQLSVLVKLFLPPFSGLWQTCEINAQSFFKPWYSKYQVMSGEICTSLAALGRYTIDPVDISELYADGTYSAHWNFLQFCNFHRYIPQPVEDRFLKGCRGIKHFYSLLPSLVSYWEYCFV